MTFKFQNHDKITGFFVLLGVLTLLLAVIMLFRGKKFFEDNLYLQTTFASGESLSKGMDVKINGIVVGKVSFVDFAPKDKKDKNTDIKIEFSVYEEFRHMVNSESYALLESASLFGGTQITLARDKDKTYGAPLKNGDILRSQDSPDIKKRIDNGEIQKNSSIDDLYTNVTNFIAQLSAPEGPLEGTLRNLTRVDNSINGGSGALGALLAEDSELSRTLQDTLHNANIITDILDSLIDGLKASSRISIIMGAAGKGPAGAAPGRESASKTEKDAVPEETI